MIYGIVSAMIEEVNLLLDTFTIKKSYVEYGLKVYICTYNCYQINIVVSGVGKVNGSRATEYVIDILHSDTIINIGSAGGIVPDLINGEVIIASSAVQYDADFSAIGLTLGEIPFTPRCSFVETSFCLQEKFKSSARTLEIPTRIGRVLTADLFIDNPAFYTLLQRQLQGLSVDAESAAIGQVACLYDKPFGVLRVIVNNSLSDSSGSSFEENFVELNKIPQKILINFFDSNPKISD